MINLTKEDFVKNLAAYQSEAACLDKIDEFIEAFSSSYVVLDPTPTMNRLLEFTEKEMEDKDDWIKWYLFEDVEKKVETEYGVYKLDNLTDLYYFLAITRDSDEDIAYYIAEHLCDDGMLEEFGIKDMSENKAYKYVCENYDKLIENWKDDKLSKVANYLIELKYLKEAIENYK